MLIDETMKALPETKIMLLEPYLIHGTSSDENWEAFSSEVALRRNAANNIAEKYNLPIIHLQAELDKYNDD